MKTRDDDNPGEKVKRPMTEEGDPDSGDSEWNEPNGE